MYKDFFKARILHVVPNYGVNYLLSNATCEFESQASLSVFYPVLVDGLFVTSRRSICFRLLFMHTYLRSCCR